MSQKRYNKQLLAYESFGEKHYILFTAVSENVASGILENNLFIEFRVNYKKDDKTVLVMVDLNQLMVLARSIDKMIAIYKKTKSYSENFEILSKNNDGQFSKIYLTASNKTYYLNAFNSSKPNNQSVGIGFPDYAMSSVSETLKLMFSFAKEQHYKNQRIEKQKHDMNKSPIGGHDG